jgi:serine/threonine-protein kinase
VALKVLEKSSPDYEEHLMLLRNESLFAQLVDHPSVVKVLALEEDEHGAHLMMEFMEGGSFHERIVSSDSQANHLDRLDERSVLRIGMEILDALGAAEARGIVHRDLKPANILFTRGGRAKLGDFGLARSKEAEVVDQSHLFATPDYVAPEMLEGFPGDFRSDLYGLGCCLYHALASSSPYQTEGLSIPDLLALKLRPVSLSGVTASPATRELLARMTDPDPQKRFASHEQARSAILVTVDSLESKKTGFGSLIKNLLQGKIRNR